MSYEIAKSIKIDEQNNSIILQCASNNIYPKHWYKGEYYPEAPSFKAKMIALLCDVDGGNIQPNRSLYKFNYAFNKAKKVLELESFYSICHPDLPVYYDKQNGKEYWAYKGEQYALSSEQIASGEFKPFPNLELNYYRYHKKSDLEHAQQEKEYISNLFYDLFMEYYKEKEEKGLYCLDFQGRIIRPVSEYRYRYGYSLEQIKTIERLKKAFAMNYHKAYVLGLSFGASLVKIN